MSFPNPSTSSIFFSSPKSNKHLYVMLDILCLEETKEEHESKSLTVKFKDYELYEKYEEDNFDNISSKINDALYKKYNKKYLMDNPPDPEIIAGGYKDLEYDLFIDE